MLVRLWWKDVRQFWPIWLILAGAAAGFQGFLLKFGGPGVRQGPLLVSAFGWALLYAFAVSAAAFAGERENNTLFFLDMMPVGRRVLWGGKASFAVVSTIGFALVLAAMAWLATDRVPTLLSSWGVPPVINLWQGPTRQPTSQTLVILAFVAILLEVLGWGLFWSAVSNSAMFAAISSIVCAIFGLGLIRQHWINDSDDLVAATPWRLALALATSTASALVIARGQNPGSWLGDILRLEIAIRRREPTRTPRRVLSPTVRALLWQTGREVWPVYWRLAVVGLGVVLLVMRGSGEILPVLAGVLVLFALVAGVNVFGAENRGKTHRFLAHHGARPSLVWGLKLATWFSALMLPTLLVVLPIGPYGNTNERLVTILVKLAAALLVIVTGLSVGQLCGMVISRGITAGLVAVVLLVAVVVPQVALFEWRLLAWTTPLLVPMVLLAVTWAWSADWMLDRPGPARWGRLGLWVALAFGVVATGHVGYRVLEVPYVAPGFDLAAFERQARVPDADNAAPLYLKAARLAPPRIDMRNYRPSPEVLDLLRRASNKPRCQFERLDRQSLRIAGSQEWGHLIRLVYPLQRAAANLREDHFLAAARDDLMILFRMARHLSGPVSINEAILGQHIEEQTLREARLWAIDPHQTAESLQLGLNAYLALPPMPPLEETIKAEAVLAENTLELPWDDRIGAASQILRLGQRGLDETWAALRLSAMTAPWEMARTRRMLWLRVNPMLADPPAEPWTRHPHERFARVGPETPWIWSRVWVAEETTPLVTGLVPRGESLRADWDRNEVRRRALVLTLALRIWNLTHDGEYPETLDSLVESGILKSLPRDPFANRPFEYGTDPSTGGKRLVSFGVPVVTSAQPGRHVRPPRVVENFGGMDFPLP